MKLQTTAILLFLLLAAVAAKSQVASGGSYTLDQTAVAAGGGTSADAGNLYKIEGTSGQAAAGANGSNSPYVLRGGFWQPAAFAPTAGSVALGGRVVFSGKSGLRNAVVVLTGGNLTAPRQVRSNMFGHFVFEDLEAGQTYAVTVSHPRYGFAQNTQIFALTESLSDVVFEAVWRN